MNAFGAATRLSVNLGSYRVTVGAILSAVLQDRRPRVGVVGKGHAIGRVGRNPSEIAP
jgi:hypothetical protein